MVQKPIGEWHPSGYYWQLNMSTYFDCYPVPNLKDFLRNLYGCNIFLKIDLVKVYRQIPGAVESIPKATIITPVGLFDFVKMLFSLLNAWQSFLCRMNKILAGLSFVFVCLDNVLFSQRPSPPAIRPTTQAHDHHQP